MPLKSHFEFRNFNIFTNHAVSSFSSVSVSLLLTFGGSVARMRAVVVTGMVVLVSISQFAPENPGKQVQFYPKHVISTHETKYRVKYLENGTFQWKTVFSHTKLLHFSCIPGNLDRFARKHRHSDKEMLHTDSAPLHSCSRSESVKLNTFQKFSAFEFFYNTLKNLSEKVIQKKLICWPIISAHKPQK